MKKTVNKILAVMLIAMLTLTYPLNAYSKESTDEKHVYAPIAYGDIDNDKKISAADARIVLRIAVELDKIDERAIKYADFNKDEKITADDARTVLQISVNSLTLDCALDGHRLKPFVIKPTCTNEGYTTNRCERCSYTDGKRTDIIEPSAHKLKTEVSEATCTEDGKEKTYCTECSYVHSERVTEKAKGHRFSVWVMSGETKSKTCTVCGYKETAKNVRTIYLTFDDGPGQYTERLLGYLKQYDVKATFFVTNQFPQYQHVLTKIVNDGHAIGVHTLTHQWSIYSSESSYLNDFNAMHKIILDKTGVDTKIFRFPGGTNNTVSRSYSRGIMASMAKKMTDAGYIYFDWNVDCRDTSGYNSYQIANYTINSIKGKQTSVVLMHDIKYATVEAVKTIIEYGKNNGYEFAVIDESTPRIQFAPVN